MNNDTDKKNSALTLSVALANHFDLPAHPPNILPEHLRGWVRRVFTPKPFGPGLWPDLSPAERRAAAGYWDEANTAEALLEQQYWWNLELQIDSLRNEIAEWEGMRHGGLPSEAKLQKDELETMRARLADLEARRDSPPFSEEACSPSQEPSTAVTPAKASTMVQHVLKSKSHVLDSVMELAIEASIDKTKYQAAWAAYTRIASQNSRPAPLLGYVEGEGVKYTSDTASEGWKFDTKRAFAARFKRRNESR
jgi:hypothetical protein